ncbi:hypothetical protein G6F57_014336 [Rhizopus arrhizus]|nr:hypothetical protein G6F57_014336 [Rhizopus arrhizus]
MCNSGRNHGKALVPLDSGRLANLRRGAHQGIAGQLAKYLAVVVGEAGEVPEPAAERDRLHRAPAGISHRQAAAGRAQPQHRQIAVGRCAEQVFEGVSQAALADPGRIAYLIHVDISAQVEAHEVFRALRNQIMRSPRAAAAGPVGSAGPEQRLYMLVQQALCFFWLEVAALPQLDMQLLIMTRKRRRFAGKVEKRQCLSSRWRAAQAQLGQLALHTGNRRQHQGQVRTRAQRELADALRHYRQRHAGRQWNAVAPAQCLVGRVQVSQHRPVRWQHEAAAAMESAADAAEQGFLVYARSERRPRPIAIEQQQFDIAHPKYTAQRCQID